MTKKSITRAFSGLALTVALLAGAAPVHAADSLLQSMDEQDLVALQAKEPAMNQGDIDAYIKLLPTILEMQDMTEADFDIAAFEKILADSEVSPIRFSVIMPKISLATMEIIGLDLGEQLDSFPSAVKPSAVEVELVKSNWEKIQEAYLATRGEAGE